MCVWRCITLRYVALRCVTLRSRSSAIVGAELLLSLLKHGGYDSLAYTVYGRWRKKGSSVEFPPLPCMCVCLLVLSVLTLWQGMFDAGVACYPTALSVGVRTCIPTLFVLGGDGNASPEAVSGLKRVFCFCFTNCVFFCRSLFQFRYMKSRPTTSNLTEDVGGPCCLG